MTFKPRALAVAWGVVLIALPQGWAQNSTPRAATSAFTPPPANNAASAAPAAPAPAAATSGAGVSASYVLSPNDQVLIQVYQEDDLQTNTVISKEGTITFPLIGSVKIGGLTQTQAHDRIADLLRARFLVNPQVTFTVLRYSPKRFTILGQVNRPGSYELPAQENIDLLEAVAMAGGFTRNAKQSNISVRRHIDDGDKIFTVDAGKMASRTDTQRFMINPGDSIKVAESIF